MMMEKSKSDRFKLDLDKSAINDLLSCEDMNKSGEGSLGILVPSWGILCFCTLLPDTRQMVNSESAPNHNVMKSHGSAVIKSVTLCGDALLFGQNSMV